MDTKVTTVIVNDTKHRLTLKVGHGNCYSRLPSVKVDGEHKMELDVNWTYQEFVVQDKSDRGNQVFISSDDCCDYERITITQVLEGKLQAHRVLRQQFHTSSSANEVEIITSRPPTIGSRIILWLHKLIYF